MGPGTFLNISFDGVTSFGALEEGGGGRCAGGGGASAFQGWGRICMI